MINKFSRYDSIEEYTTKDGSEIRELIHPNLHGNKNVSVAEARVQPGSTTAAHYHRKSEEIYVVMAGRGADAKGRRII